MFFTFVIYLIVNMKEAAGTFFIARVAAYFVVIVTTLAMHDIQWKLGLNYD